MPQHIPHQTKRGLSARRQRGIATVLILLLVGLSLTAAVMGVASYIRDNQAQDTALHAQTQAQMKAWTGAELVRQYLEEMQAAGQMTALFAKTTPFTLQLSGDGVTNLVQAQIVALDSSAGTLTAQITGITSPQTMAEAHSTLEVVYAPGGGGGGGSACSKPAKASTVLRGDVTITGGETGVTSNENLHDIAIDGKLTIGGASTAKISGCTKKDITLSGGGVDSNSTLSSQDGAIKMAGVSLPTNATLWAKSINIGNSGSGGFQALKAGAYDVEVLDGGSVVGTARAGGSLVTSSVNASEKPWVTGMVKPWKLGTLLIKLSDGAEFLIDMTKVDVDNDGLVSNVRANAEKVNSDGSAVLPNSFTLKSRAISGGGVDVYALDVGSTWGYHVTMTGYGGKYTELKAAGNLKAITAEIGTILGGGELWATAAGCSGGSCWNTPTFTTGGPIAGGVFYGAGKTAYAGTLPKLAANTPNTSPGLPGVPFCDTRTEVFNAADYRNQANYIFEFDNAGKPRLTIQNVKDSSGNSIARANIDLTTVDQLPISGSATLRQIGGKNFLACNNQAAGNLHVDALACLRNATEASGWVLNGITSFPPGIALFYGKVKIAGVDTHTQPKLFNTLLTTGGVVLDGAGHGPLVAPNLADPVASVCQGNFIPSNLCKDGDLITWKHPTQKMPDGSPRIVKGLPLANLAIGTNKGLNSSSWEAPNGVVGSVILGEELETNGATLSIDGTITVGANTFSNTTITSGGMRVDTTRLTGDQSELPSNSCTPTPPSSMRMKWSRYL